MKLYITALALAATLATQTKADATAIALRDIAASVSCNAFTATTKNNSTVDFNIKALVWGMIAGKAAEMTNDVVTLQEATVLTQGIITVACLLEPNAKLYEILRDH